MRLASALIVIGVALFAFGIPGGFEVIWVWLGMLAFASGVGTLIVRRPRRAKS
jgi:hypothetical protein